MSTKKDLKFEEALSKLEHIVEQMEQGELSLEDSMKKYKEGNELATLCGAKLKEAEKQIKVLKGLDEEEGAQWQEFDS
jgi:exodeoxyribonuclease VII small subunit